MDTRDVLARNLQALMDAQGWNTPELASRSRVDRKTINNMLNRRFDPRLSKVEAIARAFGLSAWHLLAPRTPSELIAYYLLTDDNGRASIDTVAKLAAKPFQKAG